MWYINGRVESIVLRRKARDFSVICIYGFLFEREWDTSFTIICIGAVIAVSSVLNTNSR